MRDMTDSRVARAVENLADLDRERKQDQALCHPHRWRSNAVCGACGLMRASS